MEFGDRVGDQVHRVGFSAADVDVPGDIFSDGVEFGFGFLHHRQNLLGAFAQKHSLRRQRDVVGFAIQKFLTEFLLQIHQLP